MPRTGKVRDSLLLVPVARQRALFRRLVMLQDAGTPVAASYRLVGYEFRVTTDVAEQLARIGLERGWLEEGDA